MSIQSKVVKSLDFDEINFVTIDGFPNYKINPDGVVKNVKTGRVLTPRICNGYAIVDLYNNGLRKTTSIHKLVANAFLYKTDDGVVVDHINNDRTDNTIENLRYASYNSNNRNKLSSRGVAYKFINVLPSDSLHITIMKGIDVSDIGLYYSKSAEDFYLRVAEDKYRVMYKECTGKTYRIKFRFNEKMTCYSILQLKREYSDYFKE